MTDTNRKPFSGPRFGVGEPSLDLGFIRDYELMQFIVAALRNMAISITDFRLVEYTLKLMLEVKKWKDIVVAEEEAKVKAAEKVVADGPYR